MRCHSPAGAFTRCRSPGSAARRSRCAHTSSRKTSPNRLRRVRSQQPVGVTHVSVVPMDREVILEDQTVVIRDGHIEAVSRAADVDSRQMRVIDGHGKWLMPALADMHVHFWDPTEANLFLANGIAHVRNMWGAPLHLAWQQKVKSGEVPGPRVTTTSPIVDGAGPDGRTIWPGSVLLATPEEAGPLVARLADRGYAQIKAYSALQPEPLRALGAAAKARGMPITGHCPSSVRYEQAIDAGMSCFEHLAAIENGHLRDGGHQLPVAANRLERFRLLPQLDLESIHVLADRLAREQIWNCPTLVVLRQMTLSRDDALATPHLEYVRPHTRDAWDPKEDFRFRAMPLWLQRVRLTKSSAGSSELYATQAHRCCLARTRPAPMSYLGFRSTKSWPIFAGRDSLPTKCFARGRPNPRGSSDNRMTGAPWRPVDGLTWCCSRVIRC